MLVADADVQSKPPKTSAAVNNLLTAGILGRVKALGWDPYPKPGGISDTQTGRGDTGPADSHLGYPRLSRACCGRTRCPNILYDIRHGRRQETF